MIKLRKYETQDADRVISWITDERAFRLWCADRFEEYPLSAEVFNSIYDDQKHRLKGIIMEDENCPVGHLFVQNLGESSYKFGLIIVDNTKRGKGYGRRMLEEAIGYAQKLLCAKRIVLNAFDSNPAAYNCYKSLGFSETGKKTVHSFWGETHTYIEMEMMI